MTLPFGELTLNLTNQCIHRYYPSIRERVHLSTEYSHLFALAFAILYALTEDRTLSGSDGLFYRTYVCRPFDSGGIHARKCIRSQHSVFAKAFAVINALYRHTAALKFGTTQHKLHAQRFQDCQCTSNDLRHISHSKIYQIQDARLQSQLWIRLLEEIVLRIVSFSISSTSHQPIRQNCCLKKNAPRLSRCSYASRQSAH
jgi:hypothetical protein